MNNLNFSVGQKIINIIEQNILEVILINNGMKSNKSDLPMTHHINNARNTLIKMIDSLPTNSLLFNFIEDSVKLNYSLNAKIKDNNITPLYEFS